MKTILLTILTLLLSLLTLNNCSTKDPKPPYNTPPHTKIGVAPYAIMHPKFPCQTLKESLEPLTSYHLSFLWNTFGNNTTCLDDLLATNKPLSLQVHLLNEVCVRNKNCGSYEALHGMSTSRVEELILKEEGWLKQRILTQADSLHAYLNRHPHIPCTISPGLESNLSPRAMTNLVSWIRPKFPKCKVSYNPVKSSTNYDYATADYIENHAPYIHLPSPCLFNLDGYSVVFPNYGSLYPRNIISPQIPEIHTRFANCDRIYYWHHAYNCINPRQFIDPRERTCTETTPMILLGQELDKLQNPK